MSGNDPKPPKAVRYDANAYRLEQDGQLIAMVLRLANDRWSLFDLDDKRITSRTWSKPSEAAAAYDTIVA